MHLNPVQEPQAIELKICASVETPTSTVVNSPTSSLQNEEPLPSLNVSNQESLESPNADQKTTKSSEDIDKIAHICSRQHRMSQKTVISLRISQVAYFCHIIFQSLL